MTDKDIKERIQKDEGYRDHVYLDSEGIPTCGWGHALHIGSKVPRRVSELYFDKDFQDAKHDYQILSTNKNLNLSPIRESVLINMLFNMGLTRVYGFKKMIAALQVDDYKLASKEMLDSKWARQVGPRAKRLAQMMKTNQLL